MKFLWWSCWVLRPGPKVHKLEFYRLSLFDVSLATRLKTDKKHWCRNPVILEINPGFERICNQKICHADKISDVIYRVV